ncbi:hypothetical protein PRBRB14_05390 [Hallella multisaccharivorax DSM 17128]|nr:hypothetical protein PRBRB14_05390 [Hallella multisaccharivorax DSM 17128]
MKNGILSSVDMEARGRRILDTYYDIKGDFLQLYLNEFCYKFNRRYFGFHLFDRLELCACTYRTSFKHRIY